MIKSMTGYGQGKYEGDGREYTVDIKAVNHRYNDITIKLPRYLNFLEETIRKYISNNISRGKVEVYISLRNMSDKGRNIKIIKSKNDVSAGDEITVRVADGNIKAITIEQTGDM